MPENLARIMAAELVGTTVLMLGGPGSAILAGDRIGTLGVSLAFGFSLLTMAYVIGPVSGCHINPAVSLGLRLVNKITTQHAVFAVIGQMIGGALGGAIILGIASGRDDFDRGAFAANRWTVGGYGLGSAIVVEVIFTALLVFVVIATMGPKFFVGFGGLTAGLTLALIHMVTIPVDNTSVNPARSFGTAIYATLDSDALEQLWAFILFPLVGAVVGALVWLMLDETRLEQTSLFNPAFAQARDIGDDLVQEAVDEIEDLTE